MAAACFTEGVLERDASACGGEFQPPAETETVVTDHRMLLSISKTQTTLYDQIRFSGSPSSFAWVLPIKGTATIGLSADLLFDTIDSLTTTQVLQPPTDCPGPVACDLITPATAAFDAGDALDGGGVTVTAEQEVGPYETVQLHSTDPNALQDWLGSHGYAVPPAILPTITAYVNADFDFLAMKLVPGAGVQAMRPVRVTTQGASPILPLRMVAAGTGKTTGITLWVVAEGRYEPQNFPFFTIANNDLSWDWTTNSSNYETVRLAKEASFGGRGWQVESSLELSQYSIAQTLYQNVDFANDGGSYPPSVDAGFGATDAGGGGNDAGEGSTDAGESDADELDASSGNDDGPLPGDAGEGAAAADVATLFAGISGSNVRITRMRSDIAHAALDVDLLLQASSDTSELSNVYQTTGEIGQPLCPIYDGCMQVGTAPRAQAVADSALAGGCATVRPARSNLAMASLAGFVGAFVAGWRRKRCRSKNRG
jgi:hypothetical protein